MSSKSDATIRDLRSDVAQQIAGITTRGDTTQTNAAMRLGIPQPTLSKIVNGRVSDISLELLIRVAVKAGLPIALRTGPARDEARAHASPARRSAPRPPRSEIGAAAQEALLQAARRLTASQRMEAFLEHNQLLASLREAGRASASRRARQRQSRP